MGFVGHVIHTQHTMGKIVLVTLATTETGINVLFVTVLAGNALDLELRSASRVQIFP